MISNGVINLCSDKDAVFREVARILKPGGRMAISDIATEHPLTEAIVCDVNLWASCIGGAMQQDAHRQAIETAGLEVRAQQDNPQYQFISDSAQGATQTFGVKSISGGQLIGNIGDQPIGDRQAEFVAGYARLIAEIRARQHQAKILLLPPFPRGRLRREAWRTVADANAVVYRRLADDSTVFYANFGDRFFLPDGSHNQEMWTILEHRSLYLLGKITFFYA